MKNLVISSVVLIFTIASVEILVMNANGVQAPGQVYSLASALLGVITGYLIPSPTSKGSPTGAGL